MFINCHSNRRVSAFTLIELMVVIAIISILALIATFSLQGAMTRSKVSRVRADLRTIQTAIEAYAVDENSYPLNAGGLGLTGALFNLVKPRAYLHEVPEDVFAEESLFGSRSYFYLSGGQVTKAQENAYGSYALGSVGPDARIQTSFTTSILYDPTNGSNSTGDIIVTSRAMPPEPKKS